MWLLRLGDKRQYSLHLALLLRNLALGTQPSWKSPGRCYVTVQMSPRQQSGLTIRLMRVKTFSRWAQPTFDYISGRHKQARTTQQSSQALEPWEIITIHSNKELFLFNPTTFGIVYLLRDSQKRRELHKVKFVCIWHFARRYFPVSMVSRGSWKLSRKLQTYWFEKSEDRVRGCQRGWKVRGNARKEWTTKIRA